MKLIILILLLSSCTTTTKTTEEVISEEKPERLGGAIPSTDIVSGINTINLGKKLKLWSTYYFTPSFISGSGSYCLRDKNAKCISRGLSLDQWCMIGLQGTGLVDSKTYTYSKPTSSKRVPCEKSFLKRVSYAYSTGKIKYSVSKHREGHGNRNNPLTGLKSIACDQKVFKYGQKIYIPQAVSKAHNGVFICEDVGGAVKGYHIDTFVGVVDLSRPSDFKNKYGVAFKYLPANMRAYIKSNKRGTFEAYLVTE